MLMLSVFIPAHFRHARCFAHVDVKRLIQFGLIHGLIRCVRKYPCLIPGENPTVISKRLVSVSVFK